MQEHVQRLGGIVAATQLAFARDQFIQCLVGVRDTQRAHRPPAVVAGEQQGAARRFGDDEKVILLRQAPGKAVEGRHQVRLHAFQAHA
ncbi:hypothetical protein D3C85_1668550 [compost metagenome]